MNSYIISNLLSLFLFFFALPLFGQNYQSVYSDRIAHFEDYTGGVKSLRIDSVHQQGDSILYPFAVIQEVGMNCFSLSHASWIGGKVIITDSWQNLFFNKNGDTITLQPQAQPNDSWVVFQREDSLSIRGTVTSLEEAEFLGIQDSVKTLRFQAFDSDDNTINHPVNAMEIQISQHFGFIKTLNFALFPDLGGGLLNRSVTEYELSGLSKPKMGVQNLSWRDVHNFQVGDVLHVREESRCWPDPGQTSVSKSIYTYLERTDFADSIVYRYALEQQIEHTDDTGFSVDYSKDTLIQTIRPNPAFDQLPGQPVLEQDLAYQYYMNAGNPVSKTNASGYESFYLAGDSCWEMTFVDGCLRNDTYYKGLGGPFYYCTHQTCNGIEERKLVYFEKSDTVWGTPLELTSSASATIKGSLKVYPNPATELIFVENTKESLHGIHLIIYDGQGREVRSQKVTGSKSEIDIAGLHAGIYVLQLSKDGNLIHTEKVVIQ